MTHNKQNAKLHDAQIFRGERVRHALSARNDQVEDFSHCNVHTYLRGTVLQAKIYFASSGYKMETAAMETTFRGNTQSASDVFPALASVGTQLSCPSCDVGTKTWIGQFPSEKKVTETNTKRDVLGENWTRGTITRDRCGTTRLSTPHVKLVAVDPKTLQST